MKDMDLDKQVQLHPQLRLFFFMQLRADTDWLKSNDIMDYSLLVGFVFDEACDEATDVKYLDKELARDMINWMKGRKWRGD